MEKFEERLLLERDAIVLSNARRLIKARKRTSNARLYKELFGTGFTTARTRCAEYFGLDADGNETSYREMMIFIDRRSTYKED